jgi:mRNA-degrading endonuclease RelE of RelBE toxin-antitoxin system
MTIKLSKEFKQTVLDQVYFIYKDKPKAALKFRKDLIVNLKKDLVYPFSFQKSKYYNNVNIRDYVFKGYTSVYEINLEQNIVTVFGFIKYKESL